MDNVINFLTAAVIAGVPLLFGTLGEILTEKSGNLNLGVEGLMFMGGVAGLAGAYYYQMAAGDAYSGWIAALLAVLCALLAGAFGAFLYSVLTITLRANQNVTGLALTIFGTGFGNFFGEVMGSAAGGFVSVGEKTKNVFAGRTDLQGIGKVFLSYNFLVYAGIVLAIVMAWFLSRSRKGLNLRSVGESPATADAAGLNVTCYKYLATCVGGGICGLGGMYIVMAQFGGVWSHNCISGKGWIAVALVIFATWSPARALLGSLVFGALSVLRLYFNMGGGTQFIPIMDIIPYIATVLVLIFVSIQQKRENQPPANLGNPYFREER